MGSCSPKATIDEDFIVMVSELDHVPEHSLVGTSDDAPYAKDIAQNAGIMYDIGDGIAPEQIIQTDGGSIPTLSEDTGVTVEREMC